MTPWTAAHQVSLSFTISQSLLKLLSTESEMPSNHLILCCPLPLLPSIFPSITHKRLCFCPWSLVLVPWSYLVMSFVWLKKKKSKTLSQANHLNCLGETTSLGCFRDKHGYSVPCRPLFLSHLAPHPRRNIRFPSAV